MTSPDREGISTPGAGAIPANLRADPALVERGLVVEGVLGAGGHSIVYRARDQRHARGVAIKVLREDSRLEDAAERFAQEIRVAAGLRHPHILPLYDSGVLADGRPFSVTPVALGESLRAVIDRGPVAVAEALRLAREVAEALAYLHERGWVHRDVKPENIIVESGHAVLTDFGISAAADTVTRLSAPQQVANLWSARRFTEVGSVVGTLPYVGPESLFGDAPVHPRSDVYALGIVLYEMLAARLPFTASSAAALLRQRLEHPLPPLASVRDDVPAELDAAIARATDAAPERRFASIGEFMAALDAVPDPGGVTGRALRARGFLALALAVLVITAATWWALLPVYLDPHRVVVADLSNDTGDSALASIGTLAGDFITATLSRDRGLEVINATMSLGSRQRPRLPAADSSLRRATRTLVEEAHAGLAVTGAYYLEGGQLALLAELIDTRAGDVIGAVGPIAASATDPERGLRLLADSVSAMVKRRGSAGTVRHVLIDGKGGVEFVLLPGDSRHTRPVEARTGTRVSATRRGAPSAAPPAAT